MTKVGDRVELLHCSDPHTRLQLGDRGTVRFIDSIGTVHVDWDNGAKLGLVPGEDRWSEEGGKWYRIQLDATEPGALFEGPAWPDGVYARISQRNTPSGWPEVELVSRDKKELLAFVELHWGRDILEDNDLGEQFLEEVEL